MTDCRRITSYPALTIRRLNYSTSRGNVGISAVNLEAWKVVWTVSKRQGLLDNELWWNSSLLSSASGVVFMATPKV